MLTVMSICQAIITIAFTIKFVDWALFDDKIGEYLIDKLNNKITSGIKEP